MVTDAEAQAFVVASRALVGIASKSILAAPIDITISQQRVMVLLAGLGPQSISDIARRLGIDVSNASRLCDRLAKNFLVTRERDGGDGRVVVVSLTSAGLNLLAAVDDIRREEVKRVMARMTRGEIEDAVRALSIFSAKAGEVQRRWGWVNE